MGKVVSGQDSALDNHKKLFSQHEDLKKDIAGVTTVYENFCKKQNERNENILKRKLDTSNEIEKKKIELETKKIETNGVIKKTKVETDAEIRKIWFDVIKEIAKIIGYIAIGLFFGAEALNKIGWL